MFRLNPFKSLDSDQTADAVLRRLRRRVPHLLNRVDGTSRIDQLALDSLDFVELLCAYEDEFGVRLTTHEFAGARTISDILASIAPRPSTGATVMIYAWMVDDVR